MNIDTDPCYVRATDLDMALSDSTGLYITMDLGVSIGYSLRLVPPAIKFWEWLSLGDENFN